MRTAVASRPGSEPPVKPCERANSADLSRAARGFARLWCERREDAEDIAQDALLQFFRADASVRSPLSWLFVVTRRLAMQLRRQQGQVRRSIRSASCGCRAHDVDPSIHIALLQLVIRAEALSVRDRRVLALTLVGYTHSEVAQRLGCSRGDVGQYALRAMRRLLATLECPSPSDNSG